MTRVEQVAEDLRRRHGADIPVDVHFLAKQSGIVVMPRDLEDSVSGILVVRDGEGVIAVNKDHPKSRQRFSIAHELGHWYLHSATTNVFVDTTSIYFRNREASEGDRRQEVEANTFAAALLMPAQPLREAVGPMQLDPSDDLAFRRLAAKFSVSIQALGIRLAQLGLVAL